MVTTTLVGDAIEAGERLVGALAADGFPIDAALWLLSPESGTWSLTIASPVADTSLLEAIKTVQGLLGRRNDIPLTLFDVSILSTRDSFVGHLKRGAQRGQVGENMRLFRGAIDGHFIEDAYIYFVR